MIQSKDNVSGAFLVRGFLLLSNAFWWQQTVNDDEDSVLKTLCCSDVFLFCRSFYNFSYSGTRFDRMKVLKRQNKHKIQALLVALGFTYFIINLESCSHSDFWTSLGWCSDNPSRSRQVIINTQAPLALQTNSINHDAHVIRSWKGNQRLGQHNNASATSSY